MTPSEEMDDWDKIKRCLGNVAGNLFNKHKKASAKKSKEIEKLKKENSQLKEERLQAQNAAFNVLFAHLTFQQVRAENDFYGLARALPAMLSFQHNSGVGNGTPGIQNQIAIQGWR